MEEITLSMNDTEFYKGTSLNVVGEWNNTITYVNNATKIDVVSYNGNSYAALKENTNVIPDSDPNTWMIMAKSGKSSTIEIGTVETVPSDQNAEVENVGDSINARLNFKIPKGKGVPTDFQEKTDEILKEHSNNINRIEDNLFDSGQATGSSIKVEDSTLSKFKEITVDGVCKQTATKGYQEFNANNIKNQDIVVKDNGKTIVLPISTQGSGYNNTGIELRELAPNLKVGDTVYLYFDKGPIDEINKYIYLHNLNEYWFSGHAKTVTQEMLDGHLVLYGNDYSLGITEQIVLYNFIITKTENAQWEPYTGGQPSPSPDYPQPISTIETSFNITSCNKNLLDLNKIIGTSIELTNNGFSYTKTENTDTFVASYEEYLKPNTSYFIHMDISHSSNTLYIYEDKLFGKTLNYSIVKSRPTNIIYQFTTNNTGHAVIGFYSVNEQSGTTGKFEKIQLELDEPTDYEQHLQSQITANLPEGEFIGELDEQYKDTLKIKYNEKDGKYHLVLNKTLGKNTINLNGTTSTISNLIYYWFNKTNDDEFYGKYDTYLMSDVGTKINLNNNAPICISGSANKGMYGIVYNPNFVDKLPTVDELRSLVDGKPYYYLLAEPYEVDLGVIDMPLTYYPITHLFTNCDLLPTINAKYYRDFKNTIKTMQDNLTADNTKISALESDVNTLKEQVAQLMTSTTSELKESEVTNNDI